MHLRVKDKDSEELDGEGQKGDLAHWEAEPEKGHLIRFKNTKSGKYLRIMDGKHLNAGGIGGPFTEFKIHFVNEPNHVKFESVKFPGKYMAVDKHGPRVGEGHSPWCDFTLYHD
jgi:hypothetical protein